jgi:hypothetical protein
MATLIAVYNSNGCVGRCDARCYNAKGPKCTCICGGANHGAGLKQATENTQEMAEKWLEEYVKEKELDEWRSDIPALVLADLVRNEPTQLSLPL